MREQKQCLLAETKLEQSGNLFQKKDGTADGAHAPFNRNVDEPGWLCRIIKTKKLRSIRAKEP